MAEKIIIIFFGGNILLASFWDKMNLMKFAVFDFTLKRDEIIEFILRYFSGDIFANTCSES